MPFAAPEAQRLFTLGSTYESADRTATVTRLPTADLPLPTGQIIACDPFVCLEDEPDPFPEAVPPGTYTVTAAVVAVSWNAHPETHHEHVAAAWLRITDEPIVTWELAGHEGKDLAELAPEEVIGYGVDAGTGCFVDASAAAALAAHFGEWGDPLEEALYSAEPGRKITSLSDPEGTHTLVAFPSGWGDGGYPTWIGRDAQGQVTGFLTEFFVVPQPGRGEFGQ